MLSRVWNNQYFDDNTWIISILNIGNKNKNIFGHASLLVEGIDPHNKMLFVKHYDIIAKRQKNQSQFFNIKGHIQKIRCYEGYRILKNDSAYNYKQHPSRSYFTDVNDAFKMIRSIEEDIEKCKREEFVPYQLLGKEHFLVLWFGDSEAGHNCMSWCTEKLKLANIKCGVIAASKPPKCVII